MPKSLRQEYNNTKSRQNEIISDSALKWLAENIVLINEKIDRKTVGRLIKSIQKFEDTFGPYKDKLPTIAQHLDAAEHGLQLVITGKSSSRKTSNLLKQLSYLYSTFGDFFSRDLPVLLKTPLLKKARENAPDTPLSDLGGKAAAAAVVEQEGQAIPAPEAPVHINIKVIEDIFANALKPSKEEAALLGKIYRSTPLPRLNVRAIAKQMTSLSYDDLEELTNVGKIPRVATAEEEGMPEIRGPEEAPPVGESVSQEQDLLVEQDEKLLKEAVLIMEANVQELVPRINAIKGAIAQIPALKALSGPIENLQSKVAEVIADGDVQSYLKQVTQGSGSLKDLFSSPKGKILSQANMFIETINSIAKLWPEISPFLDKQQVNATDINSAKKQINKAITGGVLGKITSVFKTQPFEGLSPDNIVNALTAPLDEYLNLAQQSGWFENKQSEDKVLLEQDAPATTPAATTPAGAPASSDEVTGATADKAKAALDAFKASMAQIQKLVSGGGEAAPAVGTQSEKPADAPAEPATTKAAAPAEKPGKKQPAGATQAATGQPAGGEDVDKTTGQHISTAFKGQLNTANAKRLSDILAKQGYKVVPK
jgi:hypothetical protein